jgi:hypothetical protein
MALPATVIEPELATWIEALAAAVAVGAKCYPWARAPQQAAKPFVLYHRIDGGRVRTLGGPSKLSCPLIQLDVVGRDYTQLRTLGAAIREGLEALAHGSYFVTGGKRVQVAIVTERDAGDGDVRPQHGDEYAVEHRVILEARIWFEEG